MSSSRSDAIPGEGGNPNRAEINAPEHSRTRTVGNRQVTWEVVTKTAGLTTAEIIVGRLKAEGIPARAWQEGAGQALGLTVGLLGTGYVLVPEAYMETAKDILKADADDDESDVQASKKATTDEE